jgi:hypothetical protein
MELRKIMMIMMIQYLEAASGHYLSELNPMV